MKPTNKWKKRFLGGLLACLMLSQSTFAQAPASKVTDHVQVKVDKLTSKTIKIGTVTKDKETYNVRGLEVPTYTCANISYIQVSDLRQAGANIVWDPAAKKAIIYDLDQPVSDHPKFEALKENQTAYLGRDTVYINHQEVPAIYVEGRTLIPAKWMTLLSNGGENNPFIIRRGTSRTVTKEREIEVEEFNQDLGPVVENKNIGPEFEDEDLWTEYDDENAWFEFEEFQEEVKEEIEEIEEEIEEVQTQTVVTKEQRSIKGINIWFDGKNYIGRDYNFYQLGPDDFEFYQDKQFREKTNYDYVGFVITEIDGIVNNQAEVHKAWLKNPTYFTVPTPVPVAGMSGEIFPASRVQGIMRYAAGGFAKGQQVHVKRASSGRSYYLEGKNGTTVTVPWGSVAIQTTPVTKQAATTEQIEAFINSKDLSSRTNHLIWTDIYRQRTYVFQGSKNNWKLIKNVLCITGKDTTPTPRGLYALTSRVPSFGQGYKAKNAYGFIGTTYLYHSVLYTNDGKHVQTRNNTVGHKQSTGCIRLTPADSLWLYNNMASGTTVYIN